VKVEWVKQDQKSCQQNRKTTAVGKRIISRHQTAYQQINSAFSKYSPISTQHCRYSQTSIHQKGALDYVALVLIFVCRQGTLCLSNKISQFQGHLALIIKIDCPLPSLQCLSWARIAPLVKSNYSIFQNLLRKTAQQNI
jgi:hypothetical protein